MDIHRALQRADRGISSQDTGKSRAHTLMIYKRITVLNHSPCCGLCGTKRHATTPFWCLGMRLCKYCLQENLISNHVLRERYWVDTWSPDFVDSVLGQVFFFKEYGSARQRSEFSCDGLDFHPSSHTRAANMIWFFWRPHLESLMDLPKLREEALLKQQASEVVRTWARRAVVLRVLAASKDKKKSTRNVEWSLRPDKRAGLARLRLICVLDRASKAPPVDLTLSRRMVRGEDHSSHLQITRPLTDESAQLVVQNLMGERCWPLPAV